MKYYILQNKCDSVHNSLPIIHIMPIIAYQRQFFVKTQWIYDFVYFT